MRDLVARIPTNLLSLLLVILMVCVIVLTEPILSLLAFICLVLVLVTVKTNHSEWSYRIQSGESDGSTVRYVDYPKPSTFILFSDWAIYLALVILIAVLLGQAGYRSFTIVQWLPIIIVISIWMPLWRLYLPMMYTITDQGIWVQKGVFRAFIPFNCLDSVMHYPERKSSTKGYIGYISRMRDFVMLFLKSPIAILYRKGLGWSRTVLLTPNDSKEFMEHLPEELLMEE